MHELRHSIESLHRKAAEYHDLAAQAHRTAAENNEKGDNDGENWHLERAEAGADYVRSDRPLAHKAAGGGVV